MALPGGLDAVKYFHIWSRRRGKRAYARLLVARALNEGHHVHTVSASPVSGKREWCEGGHSECPVWARQLERVRDVAERSERGDPSGC